MIQVFIDGSSFPNPGKMGIGVVVMRNGKVLKQVSSSPGRGTNNQAEYLAAIQGLKQGLKFGKQMTLLSDSQLLVRQLNGEYKVKSPKLKELYERFLQIKRKGHVTIKWINRERNLADKLAWSATKR